MPDKDQIVRKKGKEAGCYCNISLPPTPPSLFPHVHIWDMLMVPNSPQIPVPTQVALPVSAYTSKALAKNLGDPKGALLTSRNQDLNGKGGDRVTPAINNIPKIGVKSKPLAANDKVGWIAQHLWFLALLWIQRQEGGGEKVRKGDLSKCLMAEMIRLVETQTLVTESKKGF